MTKLRNVLVLNCGSTTIKFQVIDLETEGRLFKGAIDRVGRPDALGKTTTLENGVTRRREEPVAVANHGQGIAWILDHLPNDMEIHSVGHRVVHGGAYFAGPARIDANTIAKIEACAPLAPLHNPVALQGIKACQCLLPKLPHVASFDTAFHIDKPLVSQIFALPYEYYTEHGCRKFGFHGASHQYVAHRAAQLLKRPLADLRLITCHLGGGCTMTAVAGGKAVDTTATFGTSGGLPMGSRAGEVDLGLVFHLMKNHNLTVEQMEDILYRKSGIMGLSGISADMVEVTRHARAGNERARLARDFFVHSIVKTIGAFAAVLKGVDGIVFTAGIGENDTELRAEVASQLAWLGVDLLPAVNNAARGSEAIVTSIQSRVAVLAIPTDEEMMIAREVAACLSPLRETA